MGLVWRENSVISLKEASKNYKVGFLLRAGSGRLHRPGCLGTWTEKLQGAPSPHLWQEVRSRCCFDRTVPRKLSSDIWNKRTNQCGEFKCPVQRVCVFNLILSPWLSARMHLRSRGELFKIMPVLCRILANQCLPLWFWSTSLVENHTPEVPNPHNHQNH